MKSMNNKILPIPKTWLEKRAELQTRATFQAGCANFLLRLYDKSCLKHLC